MMAEQHKRGTPTNIKQETYIEQHDRTTKLAPKFVDPFGIVCYVNGNKFEVVDQNTKLTLEARTDLFKHIPSHRDISFPRTNFKVFSV